MNIYHISDTHGLHYDIDLPDLKEVDVVIHSGDESNSKDVSQNKEEFRDFIKWYSKLNCPNKILVPGNHSIFISKNEKIARTICEDNGIILLIKDSVVINNTLIYGDPIVPRYGTEWAYMADRNKMSKHTDLIPTGCEILITHGPPKGILDLSYDRRHNIEMCGDSSVARAIKEKGVLLHCFGHIHNNDDIVNAGVLYRQGVVYSNAAAVKDGKYRIINNGNLITL